MSFEPYIGKHGIGDLRFFFATQEAVNWYEPLKPYTLLEYEWVRENVDTEHMDVVDAGCHHGNYAIVFNEQPYCVIHCIDIVKSCVDIAEMNAKLNYWWHKDYDETLEDSAKYRFYHHKLAKGAGFKALSDDKPSVYKMDIEGAEFELMPDEIDDLPSVHTWIVEIHPNAGHPDTIAQAFKDRGFELLKVDRERMVVRPYEIGEKWFTHATLIARKE